MTRTETVILRELLETAGASVQVAGNGREALKVLRASDVPFDLVLMDVQMPEMDGLEATRRIREAEHAQGGHLPIIALTANAMKGDDHACLEAGMDDYFSKPIEAAALVAALQRVTVGETSAPHAMDHAIEHTTGHAAVLPPAGAAVYDRAEALDASRGMLVHHVPPEHSFIVRDLLQRVDVVVKHGVRYK